MAHFRFCALVRKSIASHGETQYFHKLKCVLVHFKVSQRHVRRRSAIPLHRSPLPPFLWRGVLLCDVQPTQVSFSPMHIMTRSLQSCFTVQVFIAERTHRPAQYMGFVSDCPIQFCSFVYTAVTSLPKRTGNRCALADGCLVKYPVWVKMVDDFIK